VAEDDAVLVVGDLPLGVLHQQHSRPSALRWLELNSRRGGLCPCPESHRSPVTPPCPVQIGVIGRPRGRPITSGPASVREGPWLGGQTVAKMEPRVALYVRPTNTADRPTYWLVGPGVMSVIEAIQTERLHLLPFTADDAEAAFGWFGDPEVMQFVPKGPDTLLEATRRRIGNYQQHQVTHGFSKWVIRQRGSVEPIGDSGLLLLDELEAIDLGFRLARPYWGRGFATEAASAWVRVAFLDLGLGRLTAFTHPSNLPSVAVLRKVGFSSTGARQVMGMDALTFVYEASQFRAAAGQGGRPTMR